MSLKISKKKRLAQAENSKLATESKLAKRLEVDIELDALRAQNVIFAAQNYALIAENALQKIEIATLQAKIAAHEGIFGFVTY